MNDMKYFIFLFTFLNIEWIEYPFESEYLKLKFLNIELFRVLQ
jgi:hypothetical protein